MVYVFEKREEGVLEGGYRGFPGGECRLEGEEGGRVVGGECRLEGEEGGRVEYRAVGGQRFQTEVQASSHHPQALG